MYTGMSFPHTHNPITTMLIWRHRALPCFLAGDGRAMSVQILTSATSASSGNESALSTTQRPLNLLSGRECTFVGCQVGENNPTVTMIRAKQQMLQRSICCEVHKKADLLLQKMEGLNTWDLNKGALNLSYY